MRAWIQIRVFIATAMMILFCGCDTISGVTRSAQVHSLPDLQDVKARMETYPEIDEVKYWESEGGRPITLTGLKPAEKVHYLSYRGGAHVCGTLMFVKNYKGEINYSQNLSMMNRKVPQVWVDTTWSVMKKIESDLELHFGLPEIQNNVRIYRSRVEDPDRVAPD